MKTRGSKQNKINYLESDEDIEDAVETKSVHSLVK